MQRERWRRKRHHILVAVYKDIQQLPKEGSKDSQLSEGTSPADVKLDLVEPRKGIYPHLSGSKQNTACRITHLLDLTPYLSPS